MKKYRDELRVEDEMKYKKRSKTSSVSNSSKKTNHKHKYKKIIIKNWIGYQWAQKCLICGRIDFRQQGFLRDKDDFVRPESLKKPGISREDFFEIKELKRKFPGIEIYERNNNNLEYREVKE